MYLHSFEGAAFFTVLPNTFHTEIVYECGPTCVAYYLDWENTQTNGQGRPYPLTSADGRDLTFHTFLITFHFILSHLSLCPGAVVCGGVRCGNKTTFLPFPAVPSGGVQVYLNV